MIAQVVLTMPVMRALHIVFVACLAFGPARADASFLSAVDAFNAGDLGTARAHFEVMARLGHRTSQFNLATMLLNGEGGPALPADAFAWATVAAEAGDEPAKQLLERLRPLADSRDLERARELRETHGQQASAMRLARAADTFGTIGAKYAKQPEIRFPGVARMRSIDGWIVVEASINERGEFKDTRSAFSINGQMLEEAALQGVQTGRSALPGEEGRMRIGYVPVQFQLLGPPAYTIDGRRLDQICEEAEQGDPGSQATCGAVYAWERSMPPAEKGKGYMMLLRAALAGQPDAALLIGSSLANSGKPEVRREGMLWWEVAAQNGNAAARIRVLEDMLWDRPPQEVNRSRAAEWLESAAASNDDWAVKHAAALLAAHPDPAFHDPRRALALLEGIRVRRRLDPQTDEIEAAARAALGDWSGAQAAQSEAIRRAVRLGWNVDVLKERLQRYRDGETWQGDILRGREWTGEPSASAAVPPAP